MNWLIKISKNLVNIPSEADSMTNELAEMVFDNFASIQNPTYQNLYQSIDGLSKIYNTPEATYIFAMQEPDNVPTGMSAGGFTQIYTAQDQNELIPKLQSLRSAPSNFVYPVIFIGVSPQTIAGLVFSWIDSGANVVENREHIIQAITRIIKHENVHGFDKQIRGKRKTFTGLPEEPWTQNRATEVTAYSNVLAKDILDSVRSGKIDRENLITWLRNPSDKSLFSTIASGTRNSFDAERWFNFYGSYPQVTGYLAQLIYKSL